MRTSRTSCPTLLCTFAFTLILALAGSGAAASAQVTDPLPSHTSAYVYLNGENSSNSASEIAAWALHADGSIENLPDSPFASPEAFYIGISGNDLFLSNPSNASIDAYAIAENGNLSLVNATPVGSYPMGTSSEGPLSLSFDTTGQSVYPLWAENDGYQAFNINKNGSLTYLDYAAADSESSSWLSFTANDKYAYESGCYQGTPVMDGYTRSSDGALTNTWNPSPPPLPPDGDNEFCPYGAAASGNSYVVIAAFPTNFYTADGPSQLFVFNVDPENGSLSTTNTATTAVNAGVGDYVNWYAFDPTGAWLAVGGSNGVALFSFKSGTLTQTATCAMTNGVNQLAWDNAGHLVVYSATYGGPGDLYVFNTASGKLALAPGSPSTDVPYDAYLGVKPL